MYVFKVVQNVPDLSVSVGSAVTTDYISLKTGYLAISAEVGCYVEVGNSPSISTTSSSTWVSTNETFVFKDSAASNKIVGVTTGSITTLDFPEGTGCPVSVGDIVSVSGVYPIGINTTNALVTEITNGIGAGGFRTSRIILDYDTSSVVGVITTTENAEIRRAIRIAAQASGSSGTVHITEVQLATGG